MVLFDEIYSTPETEQLYKSIPADHFLIDQEALQKRLNNAYEKGFKDGSKAANLIADLRINEFKTLLKEIDKVLFTEDNPSTTIEELINKFNGIK